jgi:hypothetical protein
MHHFCTGLTIRVGIDSDGEVETRPAVGIAALGYQVSAERSTTPIASATRAGRFRSPP